MLPLFDENVPVGLADFFRARGHVVRLLWQEFRLGAEDTAVAETAEELAAIVVTFDRDFKRLIRHAPIGSRRQFRKLGRISLDCRPEHVLRRLESRIESIEFEYAQVQLRRDKRLIVEITETTFRAIG